jgi:hypothetical protein
MDYRSLLGLFTLSVCLFGLGVVVGLYAQAVGCARTRAG